MPETVYIPAGWLQLVLNLEHDPGHCAQLRGRVSCISRTAQIEGVTQWQINSEHKPAAAIEDKNNAYLGETVQKVLSIIH